MIVFAIAAGVVLAASTATAVMAAQGSTTASTVGKSRKYMGYKGGIFKVRTGAGGPTAPLTAFFPQVANIKKRETVVWYNSSNVENPIPSPSSLIKASG